MVREAISSRSITKVLEAEKVKAGLDSKLSISLSLSLFLAFCFQELQSSWQMRNEPFIRHEGCMNYMVKANFPALLHYGHQSV